jgi:IstB-like ATP binding protein
MSAHQAWSCVAFRRHERREDVFPGLHGTGRESIDRYRLNAAFREWARTFTDPRLRAAIVDRLTFAAHIIETGTDSYRLKTTRQPRQKAAA